VAATPATPAMISHLLDLQTLKASATYHGAAGSTPVDDGWQLVFGLLVA